MEELELVISVSAEIRLDLYHLLKWAVLFIEVGQLLKEFMQAQHVI
jgi:hypothetical protein